MSSKKCPHCGLYSPDTALRCDCGYDFASQQLKASYLQATKPHSTSAAGTATTTAPVSSVSAVRWIQGICWSIIGLFSVTKLYMLTQQSLPDWLDVTNPSLAGLVFTASVVALVVVKLNR